MSLDDPRPAPPVGSARVTCSGTYQTHKWAIVFWANLTTSLAAQADLNTLATKVSAQWNTNIVPLQTAGTIMNSVLMVWTPTAGTELVAIDGTVRTGSAVGAEITNASSCAVINHRTGAYYRGGHSRTYLPGLGQTSITLGSLISAAVMTSWAAGWTAFVTGVQTGAVGAISAVQLGTVRFQSGKDWLVPPVFVPWVSHTVRQTLGTQRGRLTE